jgi:transcriptional regulator with XRE-family HTH domain
VDETQIFKIIGRKIRQRRKLLGLAQADLACKCGVSFQQIQKYEYGMNKIHAARLVLLAKCLGVHMSYFAEGEIEDWLSS